MRNIRESWIVCWWWCEVCWLVLPADRRPHTGLAARPQPSLATNLSENPSGIITQDTWGGHRLQEEKFLHLPELLSLLPCPFSLPHVDFISPHSEWK